MLVWIYLEFPEFLRNKRILLKMDSQVAVAWLLNGRVPSFPFYRLMIFLAFIEWKMNCIILPVWIKGTKNPADALTRKLVWNPPVFRYRRVNYPIRTIPLRLIRIFIKVLTGSFNYSKHFFPAVLPNISYNRRARFLPPEVCRIEITKSIYIYLLLNCSVCRIGCETGRGILESCRAS